MENMVTVFLFGKKYEVPDSLTIMEAMEYSGYQLVRGCGTAMPTKEMGPANAVTQADRTLESKISAVRNARRWTPMFCAYTSPSW